MAKIQTNFRLLPEVFKKLKKLAKKRKTSQTAVINELIKLAE
jgi:predicted DNA-binding protein